MARQVEPGPDMVRSMVDYAPDLRKGEPGAIGSRAAGPGDAAVKRRARLSPSEVKCLRLCQ